MKKTWKKILLIGGLCLVVITGLLFAIPRTRESILWHLNDWATQLRARFNPPEEISFDPNQSATLDLQATMTALVPLATSTPESTNEITPIESPTQEPLPMKTNIEGGTFYTQRGFNNYCAPANLSMLLSYWGWDGKVEDVGKVLKPYAMDKNVMLYEMLDYAESLGYEGFIRSAGSLNTLKQFIAAGFPVLIERGVFFHDLTGLTSWMGHFGVVTGYDEDTRNFTIQDSYIETGPNNNGADYQMPYDTLLDEWQSFNYIYLVIFPQDQKQQAYDLLGADSDETTNYQNAWILASNETTAYVDRKQFFAWYNVGTSLVGLQDYSGASAAYDTAFYLYNLLPEDLSYRPFRILWYETGPYKAYFYTGQYQRVIDLATNNALGAIRDNEFALEESYYWRGQAYQALGDLDTAIDDFRTALRYHPGFTPAIDALVNLGETP